MTPGVAELLGQPVAKQDPVGQIGQRVVEGEMGEARLGRLALGDVERGAEDARDVAAGIVDRHLGREPGPFPALAVARHLLELR